ncbi:hypothetical protein WUBG_18387 [Wuchereria bancrofti]|uniref:Uncharacterized protein n=1 Tax=Wuchereria bancrofti TaxID=6293 RepID=J9A9S7_WUCBA|nr:hypothetical protein WUBG_18387 [Wuchereria bancrofti]
MKVETLTRSALACKNKGKNELMLGVRKNRKKNASGRNQRWARTITVL